MEALLFHSTYRPEIFGGARWPSKNADKKYIYEKEDTALAVDPIKFYPSMGCASYACFCMSYIHNKKDINSTKYISSNNIKNDIRNYRNSGYVIDYNKKEYTKPLLFPDGTYRSEKYSGGTHKILYLAENDKGTGFYCLSYNGKGGPNELQFIEYSFFETLVDTYCIWKPSGESSYQTDKIGVTLHCPIDVIVRYNGEELNSLNNKITASFGTMTINGTGVC